ncbi:uncharacterized protein TNCV_2110611 [Trichonephila clavipes]|nr:uncharacterized protein TNCV_2110611 [Trichonephila clavipes]
MSLLLNWNPLRMLSTRCNPKNENACCVVSNPLGAVHTPVLALHTTVAGKCPSSPEDEQERAETDKDFALCSKVALRRPSKLTAKINDNKLDVDDFKIPPKTAKSNTVPKENTKITSTNNKFAAVNTANDDVEDVTPAAPKIRPVMMKRFPEYNLILKEIHRTHLTATNTHIGGYIKIQAETADHHREITNFLTTKKVQYYVTDDRDHSGRKCR